MRRNRLADLVQESGYDAVVATSLANVYYASGSLIMTQVSIPDRLAAVVWPARRDPVFVVCSIEASLAERDSWIGDIRTYEEFVTSPAALIAEVLMQAAQPCRKVGVEMRHLTAHYMDELRRTLPSVDFIACEGLFDRARAVKEPDEVSRLTSAAQATDKAIWEAFATATPGRREREIAADFQRRLLDNGSDTIAFCVLGSGENTALAHPFASERVMRDGDLLRVDVGGSFQGYYSDLARTMVVGKASDHQRDVYRRLWEVHETVIRAVRPGVQARELYHLCAATFQRLGLSFKMSHIGHSLGIELPESPMLKPQDDTELVPGMVLAVEPMHFEPTGERYHVEDLVEVTTSGHRVVSRVGKWETLFESR
ncbi:MAG: M24 family metallopeptidase [Armatimonadota bacterium]